MRTPLQTDGRVSQSDPFLCLSLAECPLGGTVRTAYPAVGSGNSSHTLQTVERLCWAACTVNMYTWQSVSTHHSSGPVWAILSRCGWNLTLCTFILLGIPSPAQWAQFTVEICDVYRGHLDSQRLQDSACAQYDRYSAHVLISVISTYPEDTFIWSLLVSSACLRSQQQRVVL